MKTLSLAPNYAALDQFDAKAILAEVDGFLAYFKSATKQWQISMIKVQTTKITSKYHEHDHQKVSKR